MGVPPEAMKHYNKLAETTTPEGQPLELFEHDGEFFISSHGERLMTSIAYGSEEELARMACQPYRPARQPKVLIGGLGMCFTLSAAVESLPQAGAEFVVAELTQCVVEWNKTHLKGMHPGLLDDSRIKIKISPVQKLIAEANQKYSDFRDSKKTAQWHILKLKKVRWLVGENHSVPGECSIAET